MVRPTFQTTEPTVDRTAELANRVRQFVLQIYQVGYIDNTEMLFLMSPDPVNSQYIYFPNKIHKNPVAVRPVVSGINGATTQVSKYLDFNFKQLVPRVKSDLKNSQQLVDEIKNLKLPLGKEKVLLVSLDVKSPTATEQSHCGGISSTR